MREPLLGLGILWLTIAAGVGCDNPKPTQSTLPPAKTPSHEVLVTPTMGGFERPTSYRLTVEPLATYIAANCETDKPCPSPTLRPRATLAPTLEPTFPPTLTPGRGFTPFIDKDGNVWLIDHRAAIATSEAIKIKEAQKGCFDKNCY